jgi:hypothetical protein
VGGERGIPDERRPIGAQRLRVAMSSRHSPRDIPLAR